MTLAPKFPETPKITALKNWRELGHNKGPLIEYNKLVSMRNAKVSIGAKLTYGR